MLFQVVYRFAFVLFLAKTTTEGAEHGVFFQIKEKSFFGFSEESLVWSGKTDSLLSCSALCGRETSCRRANFLENQRLCHLLRGEMQTSSAAGHLYQRDGSIYLTKVFAIDDNSKHDNFSTTTNKFNPPSFPPKGRFLHSDHDYFHHPFTRKTLRKM